MGKWLAIAGIGVLLIALVVVIIVFTGQTSDLNTKLEAAEAEASSLEGQVGTLQGQVGTLQGQLNTSQGQASSLQKSLTDANGQVSVLQKDVASKQSTIDTQTGQIKTMRYPRHFASVDELANWLQKDNTNTMYTNPTAIQKAQMSFVLQIRAARDGFFLTSNVPVAGNLELITNRALVGDVIYEIRAWDDFAQRWGTISPAMPSYPITPESGQ